MFKYISDIIGKFTPQQRILALLVLMSTLIMIYLGPKLITKDQCEDCVAKNIQQANQISDLYDRITTQQSECTDMLYEREMSFRQRLDTLEKMAAHDAEELRKITDEHIQKTGFKGMAPTKKEAEHTVTMAKYLKKHVEY